jgi:hypothetical protein
MAIQITGSWDLTGSFTASAGFQGTASYATYALSASYAPGGGGGAAFPYTGSAEITGSLGVTGSVKINGIFQQFNNPLTSPYNPVTETFTITASVINNIHISQSGLYKLLGPATGSGSVNVYYWLDLLPTASDVQLFAELPVGTGQSINLRCLATCSDSTVWFLPSSIGMGTSTLNISRASVYFRNYVFSTNNPSSVVKNYDGTECFFGGGVSAVSPEFAAQTFRFTGSFGTPIA